MMNMNWENVMKEVSFENRRITKSYDESKVQKHVRHRFGVINEKKGLFNIACSKQMDFTINDFQKDYRNNFSFTLL